MCVSPPLSHLVGDHYLRGNRVPVTAEMEKCRKKTCWDVTFVVVFLETLLIVGGNKDDMNGITCCSGVAFFGLGV